MMFRSLLLATMALGCAGDKAPPGDDDDDTTTGDDDDDGGPASPVGEWVITAVRYSNGETVPTGNGGSTYSVTGYDSWYGFPDATWTVSIDSDGTWTVRAEYTTTTDVYTYGTDGALSWDTTGYGYVLHFDYQDWECAFDAPDSVTCDITVDYGNVERDLTGQCTMERI